MAAVAMEAAGPAEPPRGEKQQQHRGGGGGGGGGGRAGEGEAGATSLGPGGGQYELPWLKLWHGGATNEVELIWGAASLMFFGALVSICMKCQQAGSKQEKASFNSQRTCWGTGRISPDLSYVKTHRDLKWRVPIQCQGKSTLKCHVTCPDQAKAMSIFRVQVTLGLTLSTGIKTLGKTCQGSQTLLMSNPSEQFLITTAENSSESQATKIPTLTKTWPVHPKAEDVSLWTWMFTKTAQRSSYGENHRFPTKIPTLTKTWPVHPKAEDAKMPMMNQIISMQPQTAGFLPKRAHSPLRWEQDTRLKYPILHKGFESFYADVQLRPNALAGREESKVNGKRKPGNHIYHPCDQMVARKLHFVTVYLFSFLAIATPVHHV